MIRNWLKLFDLLQYFAFLSWFLFQAILTLIEWIDCTWVRNYRFNNSLPARVVRFQFKVQTVTKCLWRSAISWSQETSWLLCKRLRQSGALTTVASEMARPARAGTWCEFSYGDIIKLSSRSKQPTFAVLVALNHRQLNMELPVPTMLATLSRTGNQDQKDNDIDNNIREALEERDLIEFFLLVRA